MVFLQINVAPGAKTRASLEISKLKKLYVVG